MIGNLKTISLKQQIYLETIYDLSLDKGHTHVKLIAKKLSKTMPSVTEAMRRLAEKKLINYDVRKNVSLTISGLKIAKELDDRHNILAGFYCGILGYPFFKAQKIACKVEHIVDTPFCYRLADFIAFIKLKERDGVELIREFKEYHAKFKLEGKNVAKTMPSKLKTLKITSINKGKIMDKIKALFNSPEHVKSYDLKTRKANWLGPKILFGLCFSDIRPGEKILDLGIGTGLISELFHKAGLDIYGVDFSSGMLKACAGKNITVELKEHDLRNIPYPYATDSMDHAVCGGVMHIFEDISPVFKEVSRITRKNGIFAFACVDTACTGKTPGAGQTEANIYSHDQAAIEKLLEVYHFELLNSLEFSVNKQWNKNQQHHFRAYSARNLKIK